MAQGQKVAQHSPWTYPTYHELGEFHHALRNIFRTVHRGVHVFLRVVAIAVCIDPIFDVLV